MRYQKRGDVALHHHLIARWWLGADVPGPKSGVHGLICLGREGTACNKAVQQSRVLIGRWHAGGHRSCSSWDAFGSSGFPSRGSPSSGALRLLLGCFSHCLGFSVFVLGVVCVCWSDWSAPSRPRPVEGVLSFLACVRVRPFLVCAFFVLVLHVYWGVLSLLGPLVSSGSRWTFAVFSHYSTWLRIWAVFRGIFRVAGYPPGGEICGMLFSSIWLARSFPSWRVASEFF